MGERLVAQPVGCDTRTLPAVQRLPSLEIVLVRHARAIPSGTPPWTERDDERPLGEEGLRDADELAFELDPYHFSAVYSSPYPRAVQTVAPTAARRSLEVQPLDDLRERRLAATLRDDWADLLARGWADPDFAAPGGESSRAAQRRGMGVLDLLRARHAFGGRLLVGSHGNLIALILQALEPSVDHAFHLAMPMPAVFHLQHDGIGWRVMGGHGFAAIEARN
jgi:2,3-bisphosphoglycerate-dependent phosphoglycerate mutase